MRSLCVGLLFRWKKQTEDVTSGSGTLKWAFFTLFWHFTELMINWLILKITFRVIDNENICWLQPYLSFSLFFNFIFVLTYSSLTLLHLFHSFSYLVTFIPLDRNVYVDYVFYYHFELLLQIKTRLYQCNLTTFILVTLYITDR